MAAQLQKVFKRLEIWALGSRYIVLSKGANQLRGNPEAHLRMQNAGFLTTRLICILNDMAHIYILY